MSKIINYLSFASKYCRRYNPKAFPIFDSIVKDMLEYYIANTNFYKGTKPDLTDYVQYKEVVDQFIKAYPFVQNYVMLDRYLWAMGKQKLEGINQLKKLKDKDLINKINELVHVYREHLTDGCINGIAEIFDGDIANRTRGCYTQAWSVGELLRAYFENVLMEK